MKAALNQNDIGLYPIGDEFVPDCENCIFLRITLDSYKCLLSDFREVNFEKLPHCFNSIFTSKPLSDVFKL